jgi:Tfp pilus assembly protein PilW
MATSSETSSKNRMIAGVAAAVVLIAVGVVFFSTHKTSPSLNGT